MLTKKYKILRVAEACSSVVLATSADECEYNEPRFGRLYDSEDEALTELAQAVLLEGRLEFTVFPTYVLEPDPID